MSPGEPGARRVRAAGAFDMPGIRAIAAAYGDLSDWPRRPDYLDHELATGRTMVADVDGEVVGFGGLLIRGGVAHLGDLFVQKGLLGKGIGGAILTRLLGSLEAGTVRVTFASSDPRALPLYARAGMRPLMPVVYLSGGRREAARAAPAEEVPVRETGAAGLDAVVELDAAASGRSRPQDHAFLASLAETAAFVVGDVERPRAYAWVRFTRVEGASGDVEAFVGPAGARSERDMTAVIMSSVRLAAERATAVHLSLLGPNLALVPLLDAGFRVVDRDTWMASRTDLVDGATYAPSPDLG